MTAAASAHSCCKFWTLSIFFVLFLCTLTLAKNNHDYEKLLNKQEDDSLKEKTNREGKLFSLFNIVRFNNAGCSTATSLTSGSSGSQRRNGTCYTNTECSAKGGQASGNCAAGFGICCLFVIKSASSGAISQNCTYLQNPNFPAAFTGATTVSYTITKCTADVCYLRLDFEMFTIAGVLATQDVTPGTGGAAPVVNTCKDMFTVSTTSGMKIPVICGQNSGQHIFVDLGTGASDSATLAFTFGTLPASTTVMRNWDIKVTQYKCGDPNAPPEGCLQYQTGLTGRFTTFNFQANNPLDNHLPNQQYSVCIRQENGFCCVQYQVCPGLFVPANGAIAAINPGFSLSAAATLAAMFDGLCQSNTDTMDYIGIADSSSQCNEGLNNVGLRSKYCGGFFNDVMAMANAPICDCTPPFSVEVFTNNLADVTAQPMPNSKGVCLEWTQLPCTG